MKKTTTQIALILLAQVLILSSAEAARKANRPWLSGKKASRQVVVSSERTVQRSSAKAVRVSPAKSSSGEKIVLQAKSYQGSPYRFGGSSKRGFDCSGLVARVWSDLKLNKVPRASSALYKSGRPVRLAELMPGDLVFFKNTYKRGISHVGIYTGKNKFVHAPGERKRVSITKLSDPYYQLHYAGARRLY